MTKELKSIGEALRREIKAELSEFRDTIERDLRKELKNINASLNFINRLYKDTKREMGVVIT